MAETPATFPVLISFNNPNEKRYQELGCPQSVPWGVLAPHEQVARDNHGRQSLRRLAQRGGLDPNEMANVLTGHEWAHRFTPEDSVTIIKQAIEHYEANNA